MKVHKGQCVRVDRMDGGPHKDGLVCRSCGRAHGEDHHTGCPLARAAPEQPSAAPQIRTPDRIPPAGLRVEPIAGWVNQGTGGAAYNLDQFNAGQRPHYPATDGDDDAVQ